MRALHLPLLAILTLLPLGCRVGSSSGTMTSGDVVVTATIARVGDGDQYKTDFSIDRLREDGTTESIAAPSVISRAGQAAEIRIEEDDSRLIAMVHVPGPDDRQETARVQVTIEEPGGIRSPRMMLPVPTAGGD